VESIQDFAGKFFGFNILARFFRIGRLQVISYDRFSGLIWIFFDLDLSRNWATTTQLPEKILARIASAKSKAKSGPREHVLGEATLRRLRSW
jgi:hypothetical protein